MKKNNINQKIKITFIIVVLAPIILLANANNARAATWTQKADMPTPRWGHSAAVVDGKIYVIGGLTSEPSPLNGKPIATVEEYDPATDTWTRKTDMPDPRGYLYGSHPVVNGRIYVIGGGKTAVSRVDVYDPAADTWSRSADMPTRRMLMARAVWNGKIYAFGGKTGTLGSSAPTINVTEVYDPQTDTWTQAAPMPRGVWEHSACVADDKIYVIGGATATNSEQIFQVYDPLTDTWSNATPKPLNTRGFGATEVCSKIYTVGGWLNSGQRPYAEMWIYDTATDTWVAGVSLPENRATLTISMVNGKIYAIGGTPSQHNCQATSTVYELILESPPPDFNGDGIIDGADVSIMVDHWHTDNELYDIAPAPCGDGIVDVQDLIFLSEHLFEEVNDPTLVAHWTLDETEGMTAHENVSGHDDFIVGEALWQPVGGMIGGALELDGIDDCIISSTGINSAETPFSVIAWIKGGTPGQTIISQSGGVNWLMIDAEGNLMTEFKGSGRNSGPLMSQTIITDSTWHRIGFVWDGSNRMLFVDGVPVAQDMQNGLVSFGSGLFIGVGKDYAAGTFFSGLIDDVRIYNRVVSP
jgi:N-acetylneuraminic acid mutarotase